MKSGLEARTKILNILEQEVLSASEIAQKVALSYVAVMYHLHLLEAEGTIRRKAKRPYFWEVTGAGQKRLID